MIDTHAHIYDETYEKDFGTILTNAEQAGIKKIILPAAAEPDFEKIINIIENYSNLYGAIGVHPDEANLYSKDTHNKILEFAKHDKIIAIGEIGLDYYWDKTYIEEQKAMFKDQLEIAMELKLPVLIHDREAHENTFNILKETKIAESIPVIMHCFSGSYEFAKRCVNEGFYLALGGVTTFKNAKKTKEVAEKIPLEYLLLETDSPYLTPTPHRGKRNEPAYVKLVAEQIAELKGISMEEVDKITTQNAERIFKF